MAAGTKRRHPGAAATGPSPKLHRTLSASSASSSSSSRTSPFSKYAAASPPPSSQPATATPDSIPPSSSSPPSAATAAAAAGVPASMRPQLALIAASHRTSFEKRVWTALCAVPRGRVTTYGRLAAHLARNSSGTGTGGTGGKAKGSAASSASPRAVGNALRRNPFALGVPCHRVVAADMALGGFKGKSLARDGEGITLDEKRRLLRAEGVRFDAAGRVLGTPWEGWA